MASIKLLDRLHRNVLFWGRLDRVGPDLGGLVDVVLTGQNCLPVPAQVSLELAGKLRSMLGQQVTIGHINGLWVCGTMRADSEISRKKAIIDGRC